MKAIGSYALPFLCLPMNSSGSTGIARFQSSCDGMFLNCVFVRCLPLGLFLKLKRKVSSVLRLSLPSFCAQLQSFCEVLLCRTIRWARTCGLWRGSQVEVWTPVPQKNLRPFSLRRWFRFDTSCFNVRAKT